jgi:type IV pilus assembly protein PilB
MADFEKERDIVIGLVRQGTLSKQQAQAAYEAAKQNGGSLLEAVVGMGFAVQEEVDELLRRPPGEAMSLRQVEVDTGVAYGISRELAERTRAVPFRRRGDTVEVAMADPEDLHALDEVARALKCRIRAIRASEADIAWAIETYWSQETTKDLDGEYGTSLDGLVEGVDSIARLMDAQPIVRLASVLVSEAVRRRASDIHLEPQRQGLIVRYRIDGVLEKQMQIDEAIKPALVSRLKIMADMDIGESRLPQDGRFTTTVDKRRIDVRASSRPTIFGEKLVLRILDKSQVFVNMDQLGLPNYIAQAMGAVLHVSRGLIACVGPTGSGKTTTLYAALHTLRNEGSNIEAIEDPVEYQLTGVNQAYVRPDIGLTFPEHLRAILRQDPDVILIGEVRDAETADMAFRAALTGHLVLTTLHANDAPSALVRCQEMKIEPYLVASALRCLIAQRLARRVCANCRVEYAAQEVVGEVPFLAELLESRQIASLYRGKGCEECRGTGFRGRVGLYEMLRMTPRLRAMVLAGTTEEQARAVAIEEGMEPMEHDALQKLRAGVTGIESLLSIYADRMTEYGDQLAALLRKR